MKRHDTMPMLQTQTLTPDAKGIARAVAIWRDGGLVAFPTETVYGLGADACNGQAVARIYQAKGRPAFNPLIIHVADMATARRFSVLNETAEILAQTFWPGPLSLVLPVKPGSGLSELVTAGLDTVAVRLPENPLAQQLLAAFGGAIAAPSANPSGRISPTTAAHVLAGLSGVIDAVMDGGTCGVGLESTILLPDNENPALLRPGGLPVEAIEAALGRPLASRDDPATPMSPGQLASHYAPRSAVTLNKHARPNGALWLGFGPDCAGCDLNLSPNGDLTEAAANLFAHLHSLDDKALPIAVAPIPDHGLGKAINDRLKRAAAAR
ncbi:MAG: L-threonylcarbamoyladenylate synthase [Rhodobacterales bacterium]